jgi:hypothetical protein
MPIFSFNNKRVFFYHIPKTGGSSLEFAMSAIGIQLELWSTRIHAKKTEGFPCSPQHWHRFIIGEIFSSFEHQFTVTRHPVDRLISEYRHRVRLAMDNKQHPLPFSQWVDFVFDKQVKNPYFLDNHIRPQVQFFDETTRLFKFEDGLDQPLAYACDVLGVAPPAGMPVLLKGMNLQVDLDDPILEKIFNFYREDFACLGYDLHGFRYPAH